jgi:hypothetical protein
MRVLLISANTEQINMPVLPLGLAYVAAAADSQGHTVKMLNLMMQINTQKALHEAIDEFNPEIIGISVRNIDDQNMENPRFLLETVKDVVTNCRKYSGATIVLGGAGYSIFPQATLDFLKADIGIQGEGESLVFADSLELEAMKITIGIRIYPHTSLAQTAIKEGLITADDNLLIPKFYIVKGLESWLRETVKTWMETRTHWVM